MVKTPSVVVTIIIIFILDSITNIEDKPKVASSQEILEHVPRQNSAFNMENLITPYLRFFIYKIGKNNYCFFSI